MNQIKLNTLNLLLHQDEIELMKKVYISNLIYDVVRMTPKLMAQVCTTLSMYDLIVTVCIQ